MYIKYDFIIIINIYFVLLTITNIYNEIVYNFLNSNYFINFSLTLKIINKYKIK